MFPQIWIPLDALFRIYKNRPAARPNANATPAGLQGRKPSEVFSMPDPKATVRPRVERGKGQAGVPRKSRKVDLQPVTTLASTSTSVVPSASRSSAPSSAVATLR